MTNRTASTVSTLSPVSPVSPVQTSTASAVGGAGLGRRHFLVAGAGVAGACVLVACSPGAGSPEPTGGTGGSQATPGGPLVALADVPVGGAVSAKTGAGDDIVIAQPQEGTVVAFSAICTHQGCVVAPDGAELVCPCHGSVYEAATGANVSGPAPLPLPAFAVEVKDGQVVEA
ncbi:Rieske (2Fe-2S) protein [Cellulomonas sp. KRMCY2]|uniref:Rieske (2Fe-2S) protein n=1 Tax=Cellulomonas sp. KRMCY2 TaxID=1304865 RepID=UPI00045E6E89|nr:Rieske (2Fe-2S) protein [Cellulomonas sp. KRMCY2]